MVRDLGLEIVAFQPFRDFEGLPEPARGRAFERARRKFQLMNELGAETILVCSSVSPQSLGGIDRSAEDLRALGDLAAEFGVRAGYEALAWGRHVSDYRDAWEIVRRAGSRPDRAHPGQFPHAVAGPAGRRRSDRSQPTGSASSRSPTRRA